MSEIRKYRINRLKFVGYLILGFVFYAIPFTLFEIKIEKATAFYVGFFLLLIGCFLASAEIKE